MLPLSIPVGPVPPSRKNPQCLLLYGQPKCGKTTAAAALPDSLLLELEPGGADFVSARKIDVPDAAALHQLVDMLTSARQKGEPIVRRLIIDTIDIVEQWSDPEATAAYKQSPLGKNWEGTSILELPMGAGYQRLRDKMGEWLWAFSQAAEEVVLLAHVRDRMITKEVGEASTKDIDLTGKIRNIVCARSSAVGFLFRNAQGALMVTFKTSDSVNCGSRCEHLAGQDFVLGQAGPDGKLAFDWGKIYIQ